MIAKTIHNKGFKWYNNQFTKVKGYLFDQHNKLFKDLSLITYFDHSCTENNLINNLKSANGSFAGIVNSENFIYVFVDRLRSIPLFYSLKNNQIYISDDVKELSNETNYTSINQLTKEYIIHLGFAPDNKTLFENIHQLQGGQYLKYDKINNKLELKTYFEHHHIQTPNITKLEYFNEFESKLNEIFNRLIKSVNGKTIVIPLSGGLDSRLIATMLKKLNYTNVICYTYGLPNSYEAKIAQKVAFNLGFQWHFIQYSEEIYLNYFKEDAHQFRQLTANYCALAQEQEYFAVKELVDKKLIKTDAVFVPGYCGDLPAGSYLPNYQDQIIIQKNKANAIIYLIKKHLGTQINKPQIESVKKDLNEKFLKLNWNNYDEFISTHENWFTVNKVSKYIVNGLRTFEYYNFEWRMPLWDNDFTNLFYKLPNNYRTDKNLYVEYISEYIFDPFNVNFKLKNFNQNFNHNSIFNSIKNNLPQFFKKILKQIFLKKIDIDVNNTNTLHKLVNEHIFNNKFKDDDKTLNYILASWYISEIE